MISPDYAGWWRRTTAVVKASWRPLLVLQAIAAVVSFAVEGTIGVVQASTVDAGADAGQVLAVSGLALLGTLLVVLVSTVIGLAAVRVVVVTATGGQPRIADCLAGAARRLPAMVGWEILAGLIIFLGLCACVLPGIYLVAVFIVLVPVIAVERQEPISRCFKLFHRDLGVSVARVATILGLTLGGAAVGVAVAVVAEIAVPAESASTPALIVSTLVTSALGLVVAGALRMLTDPLTVSAYADMRARMEPVSSAVLAAELATR